MALVWCPRYLNTGTLATPNIAAFDKATKIMPDMFSELVLPQERKGFLLHAKYVCVCMCVCARAVVVVWVGERGREAHRAGSGPAAGWDSGPRQCAGTVGVGVGRAVVRAELINAVGTPIPDVGCDCYSFTVTALLLVRRYMIMSERRGEHAGGGEEVAWVYVTHYRARCQGRRTARRHSSTAYLDHMDGT